MNPALEALPARPLTAEDVATLNDAPALGIIPYSWYGEQVIALLLLYDERRAGEEQDARADEHDADAGAGAHQDTTAEAADQEQPVAEEQQADDGTDFAANEAADEQRPEADEQQTAGKNQSEDADSDQSTDADERERDDPTAASSSTTSGFGSDDSPGVGTVEVIDSGDLTPKPDEDSLAPDLGGESDPEPVDLTESDDESGGPAGGPTPEPQDGDAEETEQTEPPEENEQDASGEGAPPQGPSGPDLSGQETSGVEDTAQETPTEDDTPQETSGTSEQDTPGTSDPEQDEAEALHVYAVGFDGGVDSWVAIAEIDPDAELTDAEPLFREWATRTYHDQIVDRLAIGPSEYDIDE